MSTSEDLAARIYPDANGSAYAAFRPHMTASEAADITNAMGRPALGAGEAKTEAMKLLTAEFGAEKAAAAYAGAINFAKNTPAIQKVAGKNSALGNSPTAILTLAKVAARRGGK